MVSPTSGTLTNQIAPRNRLTTWMLLKHGVGIGRRSSIMERKEGRKCFS